MSLASSRCVALQTSAYCSRVAMNSLRSLSMHCNLFSVKPAFACRPDAAA